LISIGVPVQGSSVNGHYEDEPLIFGPENGDDWFYFEDSTADSSASSPWAKDNPSPFIVSSVSGGETTLIRFKHKSTPDHTVLHKGACNFAGLKPAYTGKHDKDLPSARLTVQEL
jgi:hypothetical protein